MEHSRAEPPPRTTADLAADPTISDLAVRLFAAISRGPHSLDDLSACTPSSDDAIRLALHELLDRNLLRVSDSRYSTRPTPVSIFRPRKETMLSVLGKAEAEEIGTRFAEIMPGLDPHDLPSLLSGMPADGLSSEAIDAALRRAYGKCALSADMARKSPILFPERLMARHVNECLAYAKETAE